MLYYKIMWNLNKGKSMVTITLTEEGKRRAVNFINEGVYESEVTWNHDTELIDCIEEELTAQANRKKDNTVLTLVIPRSKSKSNGNEYFNLFDRCDYSREVIL